MSMSMVKSAQSLKGLYCLMICVISISVYAMQSLTLDNKSSKVGFAGEHAGMKFQGVFEKWQATLVLPPAANPSVSASFELSSAKTGDFTYDSTLPEGDWFDAKNHPIGLFQSTSVELFDNDYVVSGMLTLRGVALQQTFTLKRKGNTLSAQFPINRLAYGIGVESDPDAEWVSENITLTLTLAANQ